MKMQRREFITLLGGATATAGVLRPLAVDAQQRARLRRIGYLMGLAADDPEGQARVTAFVQGLQELGWTDGRTIRMEYRSGASTGNRYRVFAEELVALAPDAILAGGPPAVAALRQTTRTLPIVFANVVDPIGLGYVASLARPSGNTTGFMSAEFGQSAKWLELLKQLAPHVTRVAVIRNSDNSGQIAQFGAIQAVASSLGAELIPIGMSDAGEIERGLAAFARGPNDGLIVTGGGLQQSQRNLVIKFAAAHRLPAVYSFRGFVAEGGLISYGPDQAEPYRLAAGYVSRILKGEKPADLPVQAPTKFELVLNLKTARALGIDVPATVLVRATEVIE
jgi:putative tryptophan/tyrosine transport system substrate-binding protein